MSNRVSGVRNIKTLKAYRGEPLEIKLGKAFPNGILTAWMKKSPLDSAFRSFEINDNNDTIKLTATKASDYVDTDGNVIEEIAGKWYFDVEFQELESGVLGEPSATYKDAKTVVDGTIIFINDITNSLGYEVTDPNTGLGEYTLGEIDSNNEIKLLKNGVEVSSIPLTAFPSSITVGDLLSTRIYLGSDGEIRAINSQSTMFNIRDAGDSNSFDIGGAPTDLSSASMSMRALPRPDGSNDSSFQHFWFKDSNEDYFDEDIQKAFNELDGVWATQFWQPNTKVTIGGSVRNTGKGDKLDVVNGNANIDGKTKTKGLEISEITQPLDANPLALFIDSGGKVGAKEVVSNKSITENVSGTYNIDWSAGGNWDLTLTSNTILTQTNIPASGFESTITVYVLGDFALELPTEWVVVGGGSYDGVNGSQIVVQSWDDGNYHTVINDIV